MTPEARIREAIGDAVKRFHEQRQAALDSLVNTLIEAAIADCEAEVAEARAVAQANAQEYLEERLAAAKSEADQTFAAALRKAAADADQAVAAAVKHANAEAEQKQTAAVAEARASAQALAREAAEQALSAAKTEADRVLAASKAEAERALVAAKAEADRALTAAIQESRAEAERAIAAAVREAREDAAQTLAVTIASARAAERETALAGPARLLEAVRALDEARSLTDVLDALVHHAAREADRVALLLVRNDRLRGWRFTGFDGDVPDAREVNMSLEGSGLIVEAIRTKRAKAASAELSGFAFALAPPGRAALAAPIEIGGRIVGVLYADDAAPTQASPEASGWSHFVEILARHAGRSLESLTARRVEALQPVLSSA
jgi:hypothetical protein